MLKQLLTLSLIAASCYSYAQSSPELEAWMVNSTNKKASYYRNTTNNPDDDPVYKFESSTELADVQEVCYSTDYMWISASGMTDSMGKFSNPGAPTNQSYIFKLARHPSEASSKTDVPSIFTIGVLINGIPIFGKGDGTSWDNSSNSASQMGDGIWNGEAWYGERESLDSTLAAHPQADGAYHSHASPFRLYEFPSTEHSPIVGFAIDGYPIYGPYGYSDVNDMTSTVKRMETGYELRNITQRHRLPGEATDLPASEWGPDVNSEYPLSYFSEDYEWTGIGDLDAYNGRFTKTPEYPSGIYAYFVTVDAEGDGEYPFYIGNQFYGVPEMDNNSPMATISVPGSATCGVVASVNDQFTLDIIVSPNPANDHFVVNTDGLLRVLNTQGVTVLSAEASAGVPVDVSSLPNGAYNVIVQSAEGIALKHLILVH